MMFTEAMGVGYEEPQECENTFTWLVWFALIMIVVCWLF